MALFGAALAEDLMPMGAQENKTEQRPQKEWGCAHHTPPRLCTEERSFHFGQTPRCEAIPGYRSLASTCRGRHFLCLSSHYCLSYTAVLVFFVPVESVPVRVTVLLPSADTTPRPLIVTLSPFLFMNVRVWSLTFLDERISVFGSPVTE